MNPFLQLGSAMVRVGAIPLVLAAFLYASGDVITVLRVAENWIYDLRISSFATPSSQFADVVVVSIDTETLSSVPYRSPLDRGVLRDVLTALEAREVRAIGLDVLFTQPTEPEKDAALRDVLRSIKVPLVVARVEAIDGLQPEQERFMRDYLEGVQTGLTIAYQDLADGVVRTILLRRGEGPSARLGFVARLASQEGRALPDGQELTVAFRSSTTPSRPVFAQYPAHLVNRLPSELLKGKIVLVGADLPFTDRHRTPLSSGLAGDNASVPGVLIHAHSLAQLLEGVEAPFARDLTVFLSIFAAAMLGVGVVWMSASPVLIASLACAGVLIGWTIAFAVFVFGGPLLPVVTPTVGYLVALALTFGVRWRRERASRNFIQRALTRFVSPSVVTQLLENPETLKVGGESREVTFLFTDVTGYTGLTERIGAEALVNLMNAYYEGALKIAFAHDGTIDRLLGDSLVLMFNAPAQQHDHVLRAVRCALALDRYFRGFEQAHRAAGLDFGVTRIGVNTGRAIVGNFGGSMHFEYSATGDAINVAARLEGANKYLGTRICVSAEVVKAAPGVEFRPVGRLTLKGRHQRLDAFEPLSDAAEESAPLEAYNAAFELLDGGHQEALHAFEQLHSRYPEDGLVAMHLRRLRDGETDSELILDEK